MNVKLLVIPVVVLLLCGAGAFFVLTPAQKGTVQNNVVANATPEKPFAGSYIPGETIGSWYADFGRGIYVTCVYEGYVADQGAIFAVYHKSSHSSSLLYEVYSFKGGEIRLGGETYQVTYTTLAFTVEVILK